MGLFVGLFITSGEVEGAPSWPSWATQTIPACPKGTKYTVRVTWSGATYGICAEKKRKISTKATAGSASDSTREREEQSRMIKTRKNKTPKLVGLKTTRLDTSSTKTPIITTKATTTTKITSTTRTATAKTTTTSTEGTSSRMETTTRSSKTTTLGVAMIVTEGETTSEASPAPETDPLDSPKPIHDFRGNGLEDTDAPKEKIQESTSINLHSKPQGLKWIDFGYNNNNEAE